MLNETQKLKRGVVTKNKIENIPVDIVRRILTKCRHLLTVINKKIGRLFYLPSDGVLGNWRTNNPHLNREREWAKVGILSVDKSSPLTFAEFDAQLTIQNGMCAICGTTKPDGSQGWCADHNHETRAFRGVLCFKCNAGLGHFNDSVELVGIALHYLQSYQEVPNG